jgi:hypothetical protein
MGVSNGRLVGLHRGRGPVADLLECLIQIKGVADTPRRLGLRLAAGRVAGGAHPGSAAQVARAMSEAESCFGRCLALMLERDRPELPALPRTIIDGGESGDGGTAVGWQAQFSVQRAATVAVLERCTAEQLGRVGLEPSRGPMTVADLVALMLAHDTDCLGSI